MIHFQQVYSFLDGKGRISFHPGEDDHVMGEYTIDQDQKGTINGKFIHDKFIGIFQIGHVEGLIEIEFISSGFEAKWKNGLEQGPLRGKWIGIIENVDLTPSVEVNSKETACAAFKAFISSTHELNTAYPSEYIDKDTADFVEDFSLEFDTAYFQVLKPYFNVLHFRVDNAEYSIDDFNGSERYSIFYDLWNNCIYKQFPNHVEECYQFLGSWHAAIPSDYRNKKSFDGCFTISDLGGTLELNAQGNEQSLSGNLSEEIISKLRVAIHSESMFSFLTEVIESF